MPLLARREAEARAEGIEEVVSRFAAVRRAIDIGMANPLSVEARAVREATLATIDDLTALAARSDQEVKP